MIKIKTPATSANLSVGFDTVGLALNIYNTFSFIESDEFMLKGFSKQYSDDDNLVLDSYKKFSLKYMDEKLIKKVTIHLEENNIPPSRGLGSSASCILAGVLAANQINQLNQSFETCVDYASELEGHSDNIYACAYGYLTASLKHDHGHLHQTYKVSDQLIFNLLIPNQLGSTKELRNILPKQVDLMDAVHNLSRILFLPEAFLNEDLDALKIILSDRLHESYRYPYIPLSSEIKKLSKQEDLVVCLSGSGPSVLLISKSDKIKISDTLAKTYQLVSVNLSKGIEIEVK